MPRIPKGAAPFTMKDSKGVVVCGAKSKTHKTGFCHSRAISPANGRCKFHGGRNAKGPDCPKYKHGRYSAHLPDKLRERYEAGLSAPDLLSLRDEVALLEGRVMEVLGGDDAPREVWRQVEAAYADMLAANAAKDMAALSTAVAKLGTLIKAGAKGVQTWDELGRLFDRKRKLVQAESKRLQVAGQMVTAEAAMRLVAALIEAVHRHVPDPVVRRKLGDEFVVITEGPAGARPVGGLPS